MEPRLKSLANASFGHNYQARGYENMASATIGPIAYNNGLITLKTEKHHARVIDWVRSNDNFAVAGQR
jgi:hypothetical protein